MTLDGLGTFRFTLSSSGNGVETEDEVSATQGKLRVRFLPASTRNLDGTLATRSLVTGARCVRFDKVEAAPSTEPGQGEDDTEEEGGNQQMG